MMIMLSIHICAAIVATTAVVIAHSGYTWAEDTRGRSVTSRENDKTGSEVFHSKRPTFNVVSGHKESQPEPLITRELSTRLDNRIDGDKAATIEEFPFMASLQARGNHFCSMSIITRLWLVTAAHCVIDEARDHLADVEYFSVVVGTSFLTNKYTKPCAEEQETRSVSRLKLPPGNDIKNFTNDLALVRVSSPLPLKENIQPARLPERPLDPDVDLPNGRRCYVTGWGLSQPPDDVVSSRIAATGLCVVNRQRYTLPVLQKVTLPLLSVDRCLKMIPWAKSFLAVTDHICTFSLEMKNACFGDSGSPLTCNGVLLGITSRGRDCGTTTNPTVYSRVDKHLQWILRTTDYMIANQASCPLNLTVGIALGLLITVLEGMLFLGLQEVNGMKQV